MHFPQLDMLKLSDHMRDSMYTTSARTNLQLSPSLDYLDFEIVVHSTPPNDSDTVSGERMDL